MHLLTLLKRMVFDFLTPRIFFLSFFLFSFIGELFLIFELDGIYTLAIHASSVVKIESCG